MKSIVPILFFTATVLAHALVGQTTLKPGDLAIVGLASNVGGDVGNCTPDGNGQFQGRDRVSFVCFRDIEPGTLIDITDNGWERLTPGKWGNTEGFVRAMRSGGLIPAGTVITFEFPATQSGYVAVAPDADWQFTALGTNTLNFNDSGDQLYLMQGGTWDNGTVQGCCNGDQDASYTGGNILFGFNSRSGWDALINDSQNSGLHPDVVPCFYMAPTSGVTSFTSFSGPTGNATQLEWIARIGNPDNWTTYANCMAYQDPPGSLAIAPSGMSVDCEICNACAAVTDQLRFSLPDSGGPFDVSYTDGRDTFMLAGIFSGELVDVLVENTTTFELISVQDVTGCPVYSNFGPGATVTIGDNQLDLSCMVLPDGTGAALILTNFQPPYTIFWQDQVGHDDEINSVSTGIFQLTSLPGPGPYQVDVTDAGGCRATCNFTLPESRCQLVVDWELQGPACGEMEIVINEISGGQLPYLLAINDPAQLMPVSTFPLVISGLPPGGQVLIVEDAARCREVVDVTIPMASTRLELNLGPDIAILQGQLAFVVGATNFLPAHVQWQPNEGVADPGLLVTTLSPATSTLYVVTAYDGNGCQVSDTLQVTVLREQQLFRPNAFSPNEDGVNDYFTLYPGPDIAEVHSLTVFDRWGSIVYDGRNRNLSEGWNGLLPDGRPAQAGVYLYWAIAVDTEGVQNMVRGSVSLLR